MGRRVACCGRYPVELVEINKPRPRAGRRGTSAAWRVTDMAFAQPLRNARPIDGAVATLGVSDRVDFLRKTYGLLGLSLFAFAAITAGMLRYATSASLSFSEFAVHGQ